MNEVAYAEWSCLCVGENYNKTKSYDYEKIYWIPNLVATPKPPIPPPLCKNHKNWECIIVYIMLEEIGAKEKADYIRNMGGIVVQNR